jgi:cell wall-associated NlpC family hydrolase
LRHVSDLAAIVAPFVGRPWSPPSLDCWAFLREVYRLAYGIELHQLGHLAGDVRADVPFAYTEAGSGRWCPVSIPRDGDAVALGRRARPHHCGVYLAADGGVVAHCSESMGVVVAPLRALTAAGWTSFQFYRHQDRRP